MQKLGKLGKVRVLRGVSLLLGVLLFFVTGVIAFFHIPIGEIPFNSLLILAASLVVLPTIIGLGEEL